MVEIGTAHPFTSVQPQHLRLPVRTVGVRESYLKRGKKREEYEKPTGDSLGATRYKGTSAL